MMPAPKNKPVLLFLYYQVCQGNIFPLPWNFSQTLTKHLVGDKMKLRRQKRWVPVKGEAESEAGSEEQPGS